MEKKDGYWFGETVVGFAGWLFVSFAITALFLATGRTAAASGASAARRRRAALAPIAVYAAMMVFQMAMGDPFALRVVSFFAMGVPALAAVVAWSQWRRGCGAGAGMKVRWEDMAHQADPLADRTIAAIAGPCGPEGPSAAGAARLAQANRLIAGWTTNGSLAGWNPPDADPELVAILRAYLDAGRALPGWADAQQIACAEDVFMSYGSLSCTLLFCASLPECYVLPHLAEVLHIAGQLELRTEYRIRQTAAMVFPVMMKGGLTAADGGGVAQTLRCA